MVVVVLEPDSYILKLTGRLLLRKEAGSDEPGLDPKIAGDRLGKFRRSIGGSEFVESVEEVSLDVKDPRVFKFTFDIIINPETPL